LKTHDHNGNEIEFIPAPLEVIPNLILKSPSFKVNAQNLNG